MRAANTSIEPKYRGFSAIKTYSSIGSSAPLNDEIKQFVNTS